VKIASPAKAGNYTKRYKGKNWIPVFTGMTKHNRKDAPSPLLPRGLQGHVGQPQYQVRGRLFRVASFAGLKPCPTKTPSPLPSPSLRRGEGGILSKGFWQYPLHGGILKNSAINGGDSSTVRKLSFI